MIDKEVYFFEKPKNIFLNQSKIENYISTGTRGAKYGFRASYNILLLIAKIGKHKTNGE